MALEPPDATAPAPGQPAGANDRRRAPAFKPGAAPVAPAAPPVHPNGAPSARAPRQRRTGVVALSIVAVLLLGAAGTMTYLWLGAQAELTDTTADLTGQVAHLEQAGATKDSQIATLRDDLQAAKDERDQVAQELEGTRNAAELLRQEKSVIRRCIALRGDLFTAAYFGDWETVEALEQDAEAACGEADSALGF